MTNTGSLWVLHLQPHRFQGIQWIFFTEKYRAMWNWSNHLWKKRDRKSIFRVLFAFGRTWYQSFRVQLVSDLIKPNTKLSSNVCIFCSMLSYKIRFGGTSWYMKPMPVFFPFSATRYSLYNMCIFLSEPLSGNKMR